MSDFKNLKVWQKAQTMALDTHRVACKIRGSNQSALRTQMIRAAMSVPANIVESRGQLTRREACRYLRIALNSATELEYHLLTALDLKAISGPQCVTLTSQLVEVRKMLYEAHSLAEQPRRSGQTAPSVVKKQSLSHLTCHLRPRLLSPRTCGSRSRISGRSKFRKSLKLIHYSKDG